MKVVVKEYIEKGTLRMQWSIYTGGKKDKEARYLEVEAPTVEEFTYLVQTYSESEVAKSLLEEHTTGLRRKEIIKYYQDLEDQ